MKNYYLHGSWNAICQSCGQKKKAADMTRRWDGLYVCTDTCFEYRHPQDFVKVRADKQTPPWTSPRPPDVFVPINFTLFPNEDIVINEIVDTSADYYLYVGNKVFVDDNDVVNGSVVNFSEINHTSVDPPYPINSEYFSISESVATKIGLDFTSSVSDSTTLSDSVIAFTVTNKLLNAHLINEVILG